MLGLRGFRKRAAFVACAAVGAVLLAAGEAGTQQAPGRVSRLWSGESIELSTHYWINQACFSSLRKVVAVELTSGPPEIALSLAHKPEGVIPTRATCKNQSVPGSMVVAKAGAVSQAWKGKIEYDVVLDIVYGKESYGDRERVSVARSIELHPKRVLELEAGKSVSLSTHYWVYGDCRNRILKLVGIELHAGPPEVKLSLIESPKGLIALEFGCTEPTLTAAVLAQIGSVAQARSDKVEYFVLLDIEGFGIRKSALITRHLELHP